MGTWGNKPFNNDSACDWACGLTDARGEEIVVTTIRKALSSSDLQNTTTSENVIAAAAVVAAAAGKTIRGVPKDVAAWIRTQGYVPDKTLIVDAIKALDIVMGESDLRDLWKESENLNGWLKSTGAVQERLTLALDGALPERSPKKPGMPRLLSKLVDRYQQERDPSILVRIRKKIDALEDIELPTKDTQYEKPLVLVVRAGLLDEAKSLLERGADPNQVSKYTGKKAVMAACKSGNPKMLELVLDYGTEFYGVLSRFVDESGKEESYRYVPALLGAIYFGSPEMIELVESRGADINQLGINGETPLYQACHMGNASVVGYLLARGFSANDKGEYHEPPIFAAVRGSHLDVVKLLIDSGADVNHLEEWGGRPLDYADHNEAIKQLLIQFGAMPSEESDSG